MVHLKAALFRRLLATGVAWGFSVAAFALDFIYSGRLVDDVGSPLRGPVEVTLRFFASAGGSDQLGDAVRFQEVFLTDGIFQLSIALKPEEQSAIFGDGSRTVFAEIEAAGRIYPRQAFGAVPLALRVPVDQQQLVFDPETSKLSIHHVEMSQVQGLEEAFAAANQAEITDSRLATITAAGKVAGGAISSGTISGTAAFSGSGGVSTTGPISGSGHVTVKGTGAATTELRFEDQDSSHFVGFKAAATLLSNQVWTLPSLDGSPGSILKTDGSGNLSWIAPGGGGDMYAENNLSDLRDKSVARFNLGLGSLATVSQVTATEIVDGSLVNADVASAAGIATTKLSGSLLAVQAHGLGKLATRDQVGTLEISDEAITNLDISSTAGIATSKLSGTILAINGHGLGSLALRSSVDSAHVMDASIIDDDISPTAGISDAKIAVITTAGKVSGQAIVSGTIGGSSEFRGSGGIVTTGSITGSSGFNVNASGSSAQQLRFRDDNNAHFVALKAASSLAGDVTWTLPDTDGGFGQVLRTNGAGILSWTSGLSPTGAAGGDLTGNFPSPTLSATGVAPGTYPKVVVSAQGRITNAYSTIQSADIQDGSLVDGDIALAAGVATSKLSGPVTAISNHGLGTLAGLSSISSTQIDNGTILDSDIATAAAIATSKLSGRAMAIAGHGLGGLATLDSVSSARIDDYSLSDADIASTAGIATSKISGSVLAIANHGLGGLATLNSINTAQIATGAITDANIAGSAAIASTKISFSNDAISGDKIHGGVISDFASTGIDDNASALAMTILANGNIGVGATSPAAKLDVNGSIVIPGFESAGASVLSFRRQFPNADNVGIRTKAITTANYDGMEIVGYNGIDFTVNGGTLVAQRITANGNVGIGTTTPASKLTIGTTPASGTGSSRSWMDVGVTFGQNSDSAYFGLKDEGENRKDTVIAWGDDPGENLRFIFTNYSQPDFEAMRITSAGQVGLGTPSPSARLSLGSNGAENKLVLWESGAAASDVGLGIASNDFQNYVGASSNNFTFRQGGYNGTELMRITGTGNVGIGTNNPTAGLHVNGQVATMIPAANVPAATTQTIDWKKGNLQVLDLSSATGNVTVSFSNAVAGASYGLKIIQGSTIRTITWPAAVKWPGGVAYAVSNSAGALDFVTMFYDGSLYFAAAGKNYQ